MPLLHRDTRNAIGRHIQSLQQAVDSLDANIGAENNQRLTALANAMATVEEGVLRGNVEAQDAAAATKQILDYVRERQAPFLETVLATAVGVSVAFAGYKVSKFVIRSYLR